SIGTAEDWNFVRRAMGALFDGDPLRTPVEDMNKYVAAHIRRCKSQHIPLKMLLADVADILDGGMMSLDPGLAGVADDRVLVGRLVEIWGFVWRGILPYWEAV
ncbi:HbrB-like protein, partial [Terfezia boudieri ATCC MYA-4762]